MKRIIFSILAALFAGLFFNSCPDPIKNDPGDDPVTYGILTLYSLPAGTVEVSIYDTSQDIATQKNLDDVMARSHIAGAGGSGPELELKTTSNQTFTQNGTFLVVVTANKELRFKARVLFSNGCAEFSYDELLRRSELPSDLENGKMIVTGFPEGTSVTINVYAFSGTIASQKALEAAIAAGPIATMTGSSSTLEVKTPGGQPFTQSGTFLVVVTENGQQRIASGVTFVNGGAAVVYGTMTLKSELPDNGEQVPGKYAEALWGEWIRIDNGDTWYISGSNINITGINGSAGTRPANPTLTKQSAQVIKAVEGAREPYYLFASRTANATLRGRVILMDDASSDSSRALRAQVSLGSMPPIIITDPWQPEKPAVEVQPDPITGDFAAEGFIPKEGLVAEIGDMLIPLPPLPVPPDDPYYQPPVVPIPVVTEGVNFKTNIRPTDGTVDTTRLYANGTSLDFVLEVENVGTETCLAASYEIKYDTNDLIITDSSPNRRLGSLTPKQNGGDTYKKSIPLTIAAQLFSGDLALKDIEIEVKITDTIKGKTWNDSVTIRYNREKIPFRIAAIPNSGGSSSPVQGIIKVPGGTSHYFKTDSLSADGIWTYTEYLPWSTKDYFVIFSGASAATEAVYSLGINASLPPRNDFDTFDDMGIYEGTSNNDVEERAVLIESRDSIMAYLHMGDIDYYRINLGNEVPVVKLVPMESYAFSETGENNGDGRINPGESAYLDLLLKNETEQSRTVTVNLSAAGPHAGYVTVDKVTVSTSSISSQYYASLTDSPDSSANNVGLFVNYNLNNALKISVGSGCPVGVSIPLVLSFSDSRSMTWTETVELKVVERDKTIAIAEPAADNCVLSPSGGGDSHVNPGETFSYSIKIQNFGTGPVSGLTGTLSTTSSNASIGWNASQNLGTLESGSSATASYNFSVNSSCPPGTEIPFKLTLRSSTGTSWEITLPAVTVKAFTPGGLQVTAVTQNSVSLSWNSVSGAAGYRVYYAASEPGPYSSADSTGSTSTSYTHTGRSPGAVYYYKVSAFGSAGGGESERSGAVPAKTWANLDFNKSITGTVSAGIPDYYRFRVSSGVTYTFISGKAGTVVWEDGTSWFSLNGTQTKVPSTNGWALLKLESAGAYSLKVSSGEAAVSGFTIGSDTGTISETNKTIAVLVPYGTSLTSLNPAVTAASGWTPATTGAQNFSGPVEYRFTKSDGAAQVYAVTVTRRGQGGITIDPPGGDISIAGFPTAAFTVSRNGSPKTYTIQISDTGYSSYEWYVDDAQKTADSGSGNRAFTINAADYVIGPHTVTLIVYKYGVPYSNEQRFTVTN